MSDPLLTVGITCYSEGAMLRRAVESVQTQNFTEYELLVVNDASTDEATNHICQELESEGIHVIYRAENGGLAAALNTAVEAARGAIYIPLDADDTLPTQALHHIAESARAHPDAGYYYGDYEAKGDWNYHFSGADLCITEIAKQHIFCGNTPFRKSTWERVGGFDLELTRGMQDWDFWIGVIEREIPGAYIPHDIYVYHTREGTMSRNRGPRYPAIYTYLYEKHRDFLDLHGGGKKFMIEGFMRGARAMYVNGDNQRARQWAGRALQLGNWNKETLRILIGACVPPRMRTKIKGDPGGAT